MYTYSNNVQMYVHVGLYPFLGLNGEGKDGVGTTALSVHGGRCYLPVDPAG